MFHTLRKSLVVTFLVLVLIEGFLMGCAQLKLQTAGRILMELVSEPEFGAPQQCDADWKTLAGRVRDWTDEAEKNSLKR